MRTGGEDNLKFLAQLNWNTIRVRVKEMHLVLDVLDVLHERLSRMYEHEDDYDSNVIRPKKGSVTSSTQAGSASER